MREIPPLSVLCLRAIGSPRCSTEDTFARAKDGSPSTASRLLRSFHRRRTILLEQKKAVMKEFQQQRRNQKTGETEEETEGGKLFVLEDIPLTRTPAIGGGSGRRKQANDVDLNHPWIAVYQRDDDDDENVGEGRGGGVVDGKAPEQLDDPVKSNTAAEDTQLNGESAETTGGQEDEEGGGATSTVAPAPPATAAPIPKMTPPEF